jgi:hypothetical protein
MFILFVLQATDKDTTSKDKLQYNIDNITPSNPDLDIKSAFTMNTQSGDITINFEVKDSMEGYFTLDLSVQDEGKFTWKTKLKTIIVYFSEPENHKADATLKIYIVTSKNTVVFRFENDQETVSDKAGDVRTPLYFLLSIFDHVINIYRLKVYWMKNFNMKLKSKLQQETRQTVHLLQGHRFSS